MLTLYSVSTLSGGYADETLWPPRHRTDPVPDSYTERCSSSSLQPSRYKRKIQRLPLRGYDPSASTRTTNILTH